MMMIMMRARMMVKARMMVMVKMRMVRRAGREGLYRHILNRATSTEHLLVSI